MRIGFDLDEASFEYLASRIATGECAADVIGLALQLLEEWEAARLTISEPGDWISDDQFRTWARNLFAEKAAAASE